MRLALSEIYVYAPYIRTRLCQIYVWFLRSLTCPCDSNLALSLSLALYFSLCLCLSLFVPPYLSRYLSLSLSPPLSRFLSLRLSLSLSFSLSLPLALSLSRSLSLTHTHLHSLSFARALSQFDACRPSSLAWESFSPRQGGSFLTPERSTAPRPWRCPDLNARSHGADPVLWVSLLTPLPLRKHISAGLSFPDWPLGRPRPSEEKIR